MTTTRVECWVYGEDVENTFTLEIPTTKTVGDLKEAIKEETRAKFGDVDANTLRIYTIPIVEGQLKDDLNKWRPEGQLRRNAREEISLLKDLLIIVTGPEPGSSRAAGIPAAAPNMTLNCWVRGEPANYVFPVKISNDELVATLKDVIKAENSVTFRDIDANNLVLYKVSLPFDANIEDKLKAYIPDPKQILPPLKALSNIFLDVPLEGHVHVVVEARLPSPVYNVATLRKEFLENNPPQSPSSAARHQAFTQRQASTDRTVYCNLPYGARATIPPTLLHPVFGQFLDDCETYEPTRDDNFLTEELHIVMSDLYESEAARVREIRDTLFWRDLRFNVTRTRDGFETGGDMSEGAYHYAISELKGEIGRIGAEPYLQSILSYVELSRPYATNLWYSPLPCINLIVYGPYISFAAATWNTCPVAQPLSFVLNMQCHPTDTSTLMKVARHIGAFKRALGTLKEYYRGITSGGPREISVNQTQLFPYRTDFAPLQGGKDVQHFQYECQPFEEKLLFFGTLRNKQPICIKFVSRYSREAHEACASLGCAPKLLGLEAMPGGWFMVVMDMLTEEAYFQFTEDKDKPTASLMSNIRGALEQLHSEGFVHGDVRDANIMVSRADRTKFMLINFDWAGRAGEVRYPMLVNRTKKVWRPDGAVDRALITAEHDMDMLRDIEERYEVNSGDAFVLL